MVRLIAQYQIEEETREEVQAAIRKFITAVEREEPETEYEAYHLADSNKFFHLMIFPDESAQKRHQNASYTREFAETLYPNCVEEPKFTPVTNIQEDK